MYSSDNNKVFKSSISLVTLRNSYVMMHGPMNIKFQIQLPKSVICIMAYDCDLNVLHRHRYLSVKVMIKEVRQLWNFYCIG